MSTLLPTIIIFAAIAAVIAAVYFTIIDYGSQIGRAWRMEKLPCRGDSFRARQHRQPIIMPSGRIAPDRGSIRRAAA